ncbi:NAD-dependent epimerase/dehydratase family protein [Verrucomicrobiota bacterium]
MSKPTDRAVVTGAAGFIGANLARKLLGHGSEVHLLVRPEDSDWRLRDIAGSLTMHTADITDRDRVTALFKDIGPGSVFHLAAHGAYSWQEDLEQMVATNILGTNILLSAAAEAGVAAFVNAGSSSEYGFKDHACDENEPLEPNSYYAVTKAAASHLCKLAPVHSEMRCITLRLYSIYGPWEEPRRLLPTLVIEGLDGRLPPLVDPKVARDFVYVDDATDAFVLAAEKADKAAGPVYNVGTGDMTTIEQLVAAAKDILHIQAEPEWASMPDRSWDTGYWVSNPERIRKELGWEATTGTRDGIARMADWFRANPLVREYYRKEIES